VQLDFLQQLLGQGVAGVRGEHCPQVSGSLCPVLGPVGAPGEKGTGPAEQGFLVAGVQRQHGVAVRDRRLELLQRK
jgi:hypothetical protein